MSVDVSFVIPVYNEADTLRPLVEGIRDHVPADYSFEILLIDDGSTDGSGGIMDTLAREFPPVKAVHFRHNAGKTAAMDCGFELASGRYVFTLDADLQDDPVDIPVFLEAAEKRNLDLVCGWRKDRQDPLNKRLFSRVYNQVLRLASGIRLHDANCGFKCYRRELARALDLHSDFHRFIPWLAKRAGFGRIGEVVVHHQPRRHGQGKYGLERVYRAGKDFLIMLMGGPSRPGQKKRYEIERIVE